MREICRAFLFRDHELEMAVGFLGPPGVGKTHLAISLAIAAAQSGRRVYYGTLADLIASLEEATCRRRPEGCLLRPQGQPRASE